MDFSIKEFKSNRSFYSIDKVVKSVCIALSILSFDNSTVSSAPQQLPRSPNIIIIMVDDMGYGDIGCFGNKTIKTPNLDKMAAQGLLLTDYHSNGAVCTPTRCSLLTGRYQQRAGLEGVLLTSKNMDRNKGGLQPEEITFAKVLKNEGYKTAVFGKWHLGYNIQRYGPKVHGFDEFAGFLSGNVDYKSYVNNQGFYDWWENDTLKQISGYLTDIINEKGLDYIEKHKENAFLLYLSHGTPHSPYQGPSDPPLRTEGQRKMAQSNRNVNAIYKDMIESLDKGIGDLLDKLEDCNLDKNTFVVFVSDNGPTGPGSAGELRGVKGELLEGGHRVPGILWMPSIIKAGQISDQPVMSMDIFPTMLDIAKIKYNDFEKPLDGVSILPIMKGKNATKRDLFWRTKNSKAVRDRDWKYIEIITGTNKNIEQYLFNLKNDRYEQNNQYSKFPDKVLLFQNKLAQWENSVDSEIPEQTK